MYIERLFFTILEIEKKDHKLIFLIQNIYVDDNQWFLFLHSADLQTLSGLLLLLEKNFKSDQKNLSDLQNCTIFLIEHSYCELC